MVRKNYYIILENDYAEKRTMAWKYNLSWCPRKKEVYSTLRQTGSTSATDCNPPLLSSTNVSHNKLATLIARSWEGVARWGYIFIIDGVLTKENPCTIVKDN